MKANTRGRILVSPAFALTMLLGVIPLVYAIGMSFTRYYLPGGQEPSYIGIQNYVTAFHDHSFRNSLWVSLRLVSYALALEFFIGLGLALLLNGIKKGRGIICAFLISPIMIAPVAAGLAMRLIYLPEYGPLNSILNTLLGVSLHTDWLGSTELALLAVILADVWQRTPFIMLVVLAGLITIPVTLYESAEMDGASSFDQFRFITMPLLKSYIMVAILIRLIDLVKLFDVIYIMTGGGPARKTESLAFFVFYEGLRFLKVGYGSALALVTVSIVLILTAGLVKLVRTATK